MQLKMEELQDHCTNLRKCTESSEHKFKKRYEQVDIYVQKDYVALSPTTMSGQTVNTHSKTQHRLYVCCILMKHKAGIGQRKLSVS